MPGAASLAETEYYAHPRNAFWPVMQAIFGGVITNYSDKCDILKRNNIVVWDVLTQCIRPGSLDANIRKDSIVCNDFAKLLTLRSGIDCIIFNGKTAEQLFKKHVVPKLEAELNIGFTHGSGEHLKQRQPTKNDFERAVTLIQLMSLPSTSPAMASMTLDDKISAWSKALLQNTRNKPIANNRV